MSIEQTDVVDLIGTDSKTGEVWLALMDHLEWGEDDQFDKEHMFLLQEKINAYLRFIESGEIFQSYPSARGREIVIKVRRKYPLSDEAKAFCEMIKSYLLNAGHRIEFE